MKIMQKIKVHGLACQHCDLNTDVQTQNSCMKKLSECNYYILLKVFTIYESEMHSMKMSIVSM